MKVRRGRDRKCKTREGSPATARQDCLHIPSAVAERRKKPREVPRHERKKLNAVHITSSITEESNWSDLIIIRGGGRIQIRALHVWAEAVLEVLIYSAHKLQLLCVFSLTIICMSTPVECSDNKRWFCAAEDTQQTLEMKTQRAAMTMWFKPRKRILYGDGLEVSWRNTLDLMRKDNHLGPWRKCCAEILRSRRRTWIPWRSGRANHVLIGSDCYDVCMRLNTESCSLHAFATCCLSWTVVAVGRLKEHVHVRLDMHMSGWTCTLVVVGRLKEHVHVWLRHWHVWLAMRTVIKKSNPTSKMTHEKHSGTLQRT